MVKHRASFSGAGFASLHAHTETRRSPCQTRPAVLRVLARQHPKFTIQHSHGLFGKAAFWLAERFATPRSMSPRSPAPLSSGGPGRAARAARRAAQQSPRRGPASTTWRRARHGQPCKLSMPASKVLRASSIPSWRKAMPRRLLDCTVESPASRRSAAGAPGT